MPPEFMPGERVFILATRCTPGAPKGQRVSIAATFLGYDESGSYNLRLEGCGTFTMSVPQGVERHPSNPIYVMSPKGGDVLPEREPVETAGLKRRLRKLVEGLAEQQAMHDPWWEKELAEIEAQI